MAKQRPIKTCMRNDPRFSDLDIAEKTLMLYLFTNERTTISGLYSITTKQIANETGFNKDEVVKLLNRFNKSGYVKYNYEKSFIFVVKFISYQSHTDNSIQKGIDREIESDKRITQWLTDIYGLDTEAVPTRSTILNITIPNTLPNEKSGKKSIEEKNKINITLSEVIEAWNNITELKQCGKKVKGLPKVKIITDGLKNDWNILMNKLLEAKVEDIGEIIELGLNNYVDHIEAIKCKSDSSYHEHRFSFQKFITQRNGILEFINK